MLIKYFLPSLLIILLNKAKTVRSGVSCVYYPNYPSSMVAYYWTTCSIRCCTLNVATSSINACCAETTTPSFDSFFVVPLAASLSAFFLFCLCSVGLVVGCYFLKRKGMRGNATINPNWQDPTVQAQFAGKFPTTQLPPGYPNPATTAATTTANLYPNINTIQMDSPPRYDPAAFSNQPATTNKW